jgi:hypothetical protein
MATTTSFVKSRNVRAAIFTLTYADTTSAEMFKLPANALILDWIVNVQTAVSGGTTTLDVGTSADGSAYLNTVTVSAKGKVTLTTQVADPGDETSVVTPIYANLGASNTAGAVQVICVYALDVDRKL